MELVERWAKRLGVPFENDSPIEHIGYHIHKVKHKNVYAYDQIFLDNNKVVFPICNYHLANDHMIEYGSPYTWKGSVAHVAVGDAHTSLTDMEPHCTHEQFLSHQHELGWVLLGGIYRQKYADDPLMKHNSFLITWHWDGQTPLGLLWIKFLGARRCRELFSNKLTAMQETLVFSWH